MSNDQSGVIEPVGIGKAYNGLLTGYSLRLIVKGRVSFIHNEPALTSECRFLLSILEFI
jgi:hypothetical protein